MQEELGLKKEFKIDISKGLNKVINQLKVDNPKLSFRYPGILKYSGTILDFFSFSPEVSSWEYKLNDKEINNKNKIFLIVVFMQQR